MGREKWDHSSGQLSGLLRAFKKGVSWWGWCGYLPGWFASRWVLWLAGCFSEMAIFKISLVPECFHLSCACNDHLISLTEEHCVCN